MDGTEQWADPALSERTTGEPAEPLRASTDGGTHMNSGAGDYSENDQAFLGFEGTEGGTVMRGWGRLLQCLIGLALVGGVIYVWQSNGDGTDTSTAPPKDETKVPGVIVAPSESEAGCEDAVYDESAGRQLPQDDGSLVADTGGQGFGNQAEPFPSRDEAAGFVASGGEIRGARLEAALGRLRDAFPAAQQASALALAEAILAQ